MHVPERKMRQERETNVCLDGPELTEAVLLGAATQRNLPKLTAPPMIEALDGEMGNWWPY